MSKRKFLIIFDFLFSNFTEFSPNTRLLLLFNNKNTALTIAIIYKTTGKKQEVTTELRGYELNIINAKIEHNINRGTKLSIKILYEF